MTLIVTFYLQIVRDKHRQIHATVTWYEMGHGSHIYCTQNDLS